MKQKVFAFNDLDKLLREIKRKKVVLVGGCFDIFHFGHLQFLQKAKKSGDILVVILESDEFIKQKKLRNSIHTQKERAMILSELQCVDAVLFIPYFTKDEEYFNLVKKIKPDIIAITKGDKQLENKKNQARQVGSKVKEVSILLNNLSSSNIRKILNSEL